MHTLPSFALVTTCPPLHLAVFAALYQKKVLTEHDFQRLKGKTHHDENILLNLIVDLLQKSSEDMATAAAEVLDGFKCEKEAKVLRCKLGQCSNASACTSTRDIQCWFRLATG